MRFGEELRAERERRGIDLNDIAVATRVSVKNLSALEAERFNEMPGGVFNRGIIRSYAQFIGLDENRILSDYTDLLRRRGIDPEHENDGWEEFAENVGRNRATLYPKSRMRWIGVAAMMLGVLLLAVGVLALLVSHGNVHLPPRLQEFVTRHLRLHPPASPERPPSPSP